MACGVNHALARMAFKKGSGLQTFDTDDTGVEFTSESVRASSELIRGNGITGKRGRQVQQTRFGPYAYGGGTNHEPSPRLIADWFELALGTRTTNTITPSATVPEYALLIDKVAGVFQYHDCKVGSIELSGGGPGLLSMVVNHVGRDAASDGQTFPSIVLGSDDSYSPLVFSDVTLSIAATEYEVNSFRLLVDNAVQSITRNSRKPSCAREGDRIVGFDCNVPLTAAALSALEEPDLDGVAATLAITNGTVGVTISLPILQKPLNDPVVTGKTEGQYDCSFVAVSDPGGTPAVSNEITITIDETE